MQEEIGLFGARTSAFAVQPDLAIVVDVTHATDAPGHRREGARQPLARLRPGDLPRRHPLAQGLRAAGRDAPRRPGIEHTVGATGNSTSTDADAVQFARSGIPTGLVSIPLRYMHSPVEMVDLADVEATVELIAAFAARLDDSIDLSR